MRKSRLLATLAFVAVSSMSAVAAAKPPKPGKCAVASAGVAAEEAPSSTWALLVGGLVGAAVARRRRR